MSSRKEEERNEKIIRGLMKLPPNRRCINCNSLGPQYVCTNFWTFICMTCSGIHREFTHRVKSVSMSKFTSQEVEALQEGGNQRARETFLKDWDPREQRLPDNSNVEKVREFIKSVYVDKKFFASKASGKPPRDTLSLRNHEDETRRASSYHSYSQSPPYDYQYEERRYGKQAPALTKKPGSDRGMLRFLSTSRLSDHGQEDSFANEVANARVSDYSGSSGADPFRSGTQSPPYQKELGFSSLSREMSRDNLTEDVQQQSSVNTFSSPNAKGESDQKPGPSGTTSTASAEFGKFDGLDLFSAPYAPPSQSTTTSAESEKFGGLDLFSAPYPYAPQSTTPAPAIAPSVIDLFDFSASTLSINNNTSSVNQQFQPFDPSALDLFTVVPQQQTTTLKVKDIENEGWATFDMPWHAQPAKNSTTIVPETSTSEGSFGKFDQPPSNSMDKNSQWSFHQDFGVDDTAIPLGVGAQNNQSSWSSFQESNTPFQDPLPVDPYLAWGISENMKMKQADVDARPASFLNTTPHVIGSLDSSNQLPVLDAAQSHGIDTKSRNPFDFPSDDDLEASNMFLDMSSLQSSLPNHNWFPESAAPGMQIPNIQAQGPVASIGGGNPFG
ncbi:probable ADP-ribosylation factor GTPase-activating protein AGD14 isoform X2 [Lactuca sativa]|uniref:probable ADP-ribosylation factor GTPase-activating protein AGD14 isoform X2 n=1 Tax=Lactuca sativa TaxID=4236 RepID=UPI000CD93AE2|nr:probable ADP-ribosylation factor GTPase-activating protein AGD14 isoform X2 [Lactuca sativa]